MISDINACAHTSTPTAATACMHASCSRCRRCETESRLLDGQDLHIEDQRRIRRDAPRRKSARAVRVVTRHLQTSLLALRHLQEALIPATSTHTTTAMVMSE